MNTHLLGLRSGVWFSLPSPKNGRMIRMIHVFFFKGWNHKPAEDEQMFNLWENGIPISITNFRAFGLASPSLRWWCDQWCWSSLVKRRPCWRGRNWWTYHLKDHQKLGFSVASSIRFGMVCLNFNFYSLVIIVVHVACGQSPLKAAKSKIKTYNCGSNYEKWVWFNWTGFHTQLTGPFGGWHLRWVSWFASMKLDSRMRGSFWHSFPGPTKRCTSII